MTSRHALVCAPLMPEFDRESGSRRIYDFVEFLRQSGWTVSFVARQAEGAQRYIRLLQQRGVAVYVGFDSRLEQLVGAARIDLAILEFWHAAIMQRICRLLHFMGFFPLTRRLLISILSLKLWGSLR